MGIVVNEHGDFDVYLDSLNIYDYFDARGYRFTHEIITRYTLSLLTKPFVILTGISGTGKTKIAQIFADFVLQDEDELNRKRRKKFIPVRPDWTDNRGLLGFYNLLDERYHASPLLELLLAAEEEKQALPHFVILDEMNLARVEQYFSDFLSIMESRTIDNLRGETIPLHDFQEPRQTVDGRPVPKELHVPSNVFFTGTVNVDESTYMFSPKVLDRANILEFNEVSLDLTADSPSHAFTLRPERQRLEAIASGLSRCVPCCHKDFEEACARNERYKGSLREILTLLKPYNLHFGYRVINEISRFLLLAEEWLEKYSFEQTFDVQIVQKILPKFHGTQAKLMEPLSKFLALCSGSTSSDEEELIKQAVQGDTEVRYPRSFHKIGVMLNALKQQGYCSFIE